jgi:outer membrane receptor protein involved in Fe transport
VRARAGLTLLDVGELTRARPGFRFDGSAGGDWQAFSADFDFSYTGDYYAADSSRQPIPDYWTLGARLGWKPFAWGGLFLSVDNVLDREYDAFADLPGSAAGLYRMPGRAFTLGLDVGLPRD